MNVCSDTQFHSFDVAIGRALNKVARLYDMGTAVAEVRAFPYRSTDWYIAYQLLRRQDNGGYDIFNDRICDRGQLVSWLGERGYSSQGATPVLKQYVWKADLVMAEEKGNLFGFRFSEILPPPICE